MITPVTYRDCLWTLAQNAGLNPDPAASPDGRTNITGYDRSQWTQYLNDAIEYAWGLDLFSIFPWVAKDATPTTSSNTFQWSDIEYSEFWTAWRVDPRPYYKANATTYPSAFFFRDLERLRLGTTLDTDQETILFHTTVPYDTATTGEVTVFYRSPMPQWTWTPVDTTKTYNTIGTLVYAGDSDGNVYKSKATSALGSNLTDTAKWTPVTLPRQFRKLVIAAAERQRIIAKSPAKSEGDADSQEAVIAREEDRLLQMADLAQKAAPWLRRSYEDPNARSH